MITVREHALAIRAIGDPARPGAMTEIRERAAAIVKALDESESAWRSDGTTYRLVEDAIEAPS